MHTEALQAMIEQKEKNQFENDDLMDPKRNEAFESETKNNPVLAYLMRTFY